MSATDKLCVILFDEMSIKESLSYDIAEDSVVGVEDFGGGHKSSCVANHLGVFMLKGLVSSWKQPLGYFLTSGPMKAPLLRTLLLDAVDRLQSIGMLVKVLRTDQGSNNFSMLKMLNISKEHPYFFRGQQKIYVMHDPPHLIKNVRNNLKKHGLQVHGHVQFSIYQLFHH